MTKNPKILGLHLSSFGTHTLPQWPRRLKASFLAATASVLTRTSSSFAPGFGATEPRNLVAMGGVFGQVGDVDILPGLAPQVIGDNGRKVNESD